LNLSWQLNTVFPIAQVEIFGFKEGKPHENPLRVYLQCKHKSNREAFPKKETAKTFHVSDLRADGHELKQNGMALDFGGS